MNDQAKKRLLLPKRFSVAMTDAAYARLRRLNDKYSYGNNYLLTFLLENFDEVVDGEALDVVMERIADEYGRPSGVMAKGRLPSKHEGAK